MKKLTSLIVMAFAIMVMVPNVCFAGKTGNVYYVENFETMANWASTQVDFTQDKNKPTYNYSCGAFAIDLVLSYHMIYRQGQATWTRYDAMRRQEPLDRVRGIYIALGQTFNTVIDTNVVHSKFTQGKFPGFSSVKAPNVSAIANIALLKPHLQDNYPVLIAMKSTAPNNRTNYDHIVVVYKYDDTSKLLYCYDPFYGEYWTMNATSNTTMGNEVIGNFSYVRIHPN